MGESANDFGNRNVRCAEHCETSEKQLIKNAGFVIQPEELVTMQALSVKSMRFLIFFNPGIIKTG
jgi:hypothetical protein